MMPPTFNPRLVSSHVTDGDTRLAVNPVWQIVERPIRRAAGKFTEDPEVMKDLVQEAMGKLFELEPSRIDIRNRAEVFYVRRALINRMWDVVRREWLRVYPDGIAEYATNSAFSQFNRGRSSTPQSGCTRPPHGIYRLRAPRRDE